MKRRDFLAGAATVSALSASGLTAGAQERWPTRNITMIVPYPPGGQADFAGRPAAEALGKVLGRSVIVENRGGAGGAVGNAAAARAAPDGYTILIGLAVLAVLPEADRLFGRTPSYEVSQLAPVARILADPALLAVPASAPWKTAQEFIDDAKKRPGAISYGSSGVYGTTHIAMELLAHGAGIKLLHVPYRGVGPAVTGMLGNQIQAMASAPGSVKEHADAGTFRILANFGEERIPSFPDIPTFKELGLKDVVYYNWAGLFVPKGLPAPIMTRLREAMRDAMKDPAAIKVFTNGGSAVAYQDADEFAKFFEADSARLIPLLQKIGKLEGG
jgi:tripartite-type tricarboxylate transporter receptor subunit TctC